MGGPQSADSARRGNSIPSSVGHGFLPRVYLRNPSNIGQRHTFDRTDFQDLKPRDDAIVGVLPMITQGRLQSRLIRTMAHAPDQRLGRQQSPPPEKGG